MEAKENYMLGIEKYVMPLIKASNKAKTHSTYEMRKVSAAKRAKKWKQLYVGTIKEYHAFIEEELQKIKRRNEKYARKHKH